MRSLPEITATPIVKSSVLEFVLECPHKLSQNVAFIEYVVANTDKTGVILSGRMNAQSVALTEDDAGLFQLKPATLVLNQAFGLVIAKKYVIKISAYSKTSEKLAESSKIRATLATVSAAPTISSAQSKELGQCVLHLLLPPWVGSNVTSSRVYLFKDVDSDDISIMDLPIQMPVTYASGKSFSLDLTGYVTLVENATYTAKVALESKIGLGVFSNAFSFKNVDVPNTVSCVRLEHLHEENTLSLKWRADGDSAQYGDELMYFVEVMVSLFDESSDEISFYSANVTPLKTLKAGQDADAAPVLVTDIANDNELKVEISSSIMSQLVAQYPDRIVARQLKFHASVKSSDGRIQSLPVNSNEVTVLRAAEGLTTFEDSFVVSVFGSQAKKSSPEDRIETTVNVEMKLRPDLSYADIRSLLTERPKATNSHHAPAHFATRVEFKILFTQTNKALLDAPLFARGAIDFTEEPSVVSSELTTQVAFSKGDKLTILYWLADAYGNKSISTQYSTWFLLMNDEGDKR